MRVVARETSRRDQTSLRPNPVHCVQMKTIPKIAGSCCTRPRLSGTHQPRQGCRRLKTSMKSKTARRKCRKHPQKAQNVQNTHLNVQKCRLFTPTRPKRLTLRRSGYSIFSTTPLDAEVHPKRTKKVSCLHLPEHLQLACGPHAARFRSVRGCLVVCGPTACSPRPGRTSRRQTVRPCPR